MSNAPKQTLSTTEIRVVFIELLSILYNAKVSLINNLPRLTKQATFQNLKLALSEDVQESITQMKALKEIFGLLGESWLTPRCMAIDAVISEACQQVSFKQENHYESDMAILFYVAALQNMQVGACNILTLMAKKIAYQPYAQLVLECLDISRDNAKLTNLVAEEYLDN